MKRVFCWLTGLIASAAPVSAQVAISFEELGPQPITFDQASPLRDQISGAVFAGPGALDGGAILDQSGGWGVNARSGQHFLAFNSLSFVFMANGGQPRDPETVTFAQPVAEVSIWASGGWDSNSFTMQAFNSAGVQVGQAQVTTQDWAELSVAAPGIVSIHLTAASGDEGWVYDDLTADAGCYPDCNGDGVLTVADFGCFQTKFVAGDPYADCNGDGVRTVADFGCFQTKFVSGCP